MNRRCFFQSLPFLAAAPVLAVAAKAPRSVLVGNPGTIVSLDYGRLPQAIGVLYTKAFCYGGRGHICIGRPPQPGTTIEDEHGEKRTWLVHSVTKTKRDGYLLILRIYETHFADDYGRFPTLPADWATPA